MGGIQEGREVRMKNFVIGAALALGFVLIPACGGMATTPNAQPTARDQRGRGYGDPTDEQVAGAVASLGSEEESGGHFATMVDMLRGRVAGLQISEGPSGEITMRIRGDSSIYANQEPLLVVNGIPVPPYSFSSTLRTMDPQDVLSIRVLKDAGSTAAYGSRGAHGVILISLKRS
jgi:TonB-dependent SusC/RagA subfamily outer membrane receptor